MMTVPYGVGRHSVKGLANDLRLDALPRWVMIRLNQYLGRVRGTVRYPATSSLPAKANTSILFGSSGVYE